MRVSRLFVFVSVVFYASGSCFPLTSFASGPRSAATTCIDYSDYLHTVGVVATPGEARVVAISGDYAYVIDGNPSYQFHVIDVSTRSSPVIVGSVSASGSGIAVSGGHAYVTNSTGLQVIDVGTPASPAIVGSVATPSAANGVAISGSYAYVAAGVSGLQVVDIGTPASPAIVGSVAAGAGAQSIAIDGNTAYLASGELYVIDIGTPASPTIVDTIETTGQAWDVAVSIANGSGYAYVLDFLGPVHIVDITLPEPAVVGTFNGVPGVSVAVSGDYAYVPYPSADPPDLAVIDVSVPSAPQWVASAGTSEPLDVVTSDDYAYVANRGHSLQVIDITNPEPPPVVGVYLSLDILHVTVSGSYAYVSDGVEPRGLSVIDISTPSTPTNVGSVVTADWPNGIAVLGGYTYVIGYYGDLNVIDVGTPSSPAIVQSVGSWDSGSDVAVSGDHVYVLAGPPSGLHVIDVSTPSSPAIVGYVNAPGTGLDISGGYAYVAGSGLLQVIDISTPSSPTIVGSANTPNAIAVAVSGDYAYVGSWTFPWGGVLQVVDISTPAAPTVIGSVSLPEAPARVAVSGAYAYAACYSAGLQVIDVRAPTSPEIIGSQDLYDTYDVDVSDEHIYAASLDFQVLNRQCDVASAIEDGVLPSSTAQLWNVPNPFNPSTTIFYETREPGWVKLSVYTVAGELVDVLVDGYQTAGPHNVLFDARATRGETLSSGVYFSVLEAGGVTRTDKMVLLK